MNAKSSSIYYRYTTRTLCIKYLITLLLTYKVTQQISIRLLKLIVRKKVKIVTNALNGIYFCGETIKEARNTTFALAKNNISSVLDYAVEGEELCSYFDDSVAATIKLIEFASCVSHIPYVVIKPSSLGSVALYKEKVRNNNEFFLYESAWENVLNRYEQIFSYAHQRSVCVMIDAEQSWIQPIVDEIAVKNMLKYNTKIPTITLTLQCYRKSSYKFIQRMNEIAIKNKINVGIKLVRGAYLEEELQNSHCANDIFFTDKSATDKNYDAIVNFISDQIENFTPFFATHNETSIDKILDHNQLMKKHFWLGQLYGVGDHVSLNAVKQGAMVCKYLPFGPFEKSLPYLLRRIEENAVSAATFQKENKLIKKEIISRIIGKNND